MAGTILLKQGEHGAVIRQINEFTLQFFAALYILGKRYGRDYTITEGWRQGTGYHPKHVAWDVRVNDMERPHRYVLRDALKRELPPYPVGEENAKSLQNELRAVFQAANGAIL